MEAAEYIDIQGTFLSLIEDVKEIRQEIKMLEEKIKELQKGKV